MKTMRHASQCGVSQGVRSMQGAGHSYATMFSVHTCAMNINITSNTHKHHVPLIFLGPSSNQAQESTHLPTARHRNTAAITTKAAAHDLISGTSVGSRGSSWEGSSAALPLSRVLQAVCLWFISAMWGGSERMASSSPSLLHRNVILSIFINSKGVLLVHTWNIGDNHLGQLVRNSQPNETMKPKLY